ncbi:cell wall function protein [Glutamicibacter sp. BW80]|nr:cell wall function protein [Glutamicibacter sp. BW80]
MMHLLKKSWVKYLAQAVAVAVVIAGAVFYISGQKSVTVAVDGDEQIFTTRAATVQDALDQEGISVYERDELSVAADSELSDEQRIEISRNKSVQVSIDGTDRVVHTTGMTVADVMDELKLDEKSEVSLGEDIELVSLSDEIEIITPKDVTLLVDEKKQKISTTAQTVKELLAEQKVKLDKDDEVNVQVGKDTDKDAKTSTKIEEGAKIEVIVVSVKTWDEKREIGFDTEKVNDSKLEKGKTKVKTEGKKGERELTLRQETRNGKKGEEEVLKSKVTKKPVAEVIRVGTKKPESSSDSKSSDTKTKAPTGSISSTWAALAKCESGGNWSINTGNGYYGGLQFSASSWRGAGGTKYAPLPHQASPQEQIATAEKLRANGGWGHWPHCSSKLGLR